MLSEGEIEVLSETGLADMSFVPEIESHEVDAVIVLVTTVKQGCLCVGTVSEMMEPLQTTRQVSPTNIDHVLQSGAVVASEETEEELIVGRHRPIEFRIDIIEIECIVLEVVAEFEEGIKVGAAGCYEKRQFVLYNRSFNSAFGR